MAICRVSKNIIHGVWTSNQSIYQTRDPPTTWGDFVRTRIRPNLNLEIWFGPDIRHHPKFWQFRSDYIRQGPFFRPKFVRMARPPDLYSGVLCPTCTNVSCFYCSIDPVSPVLAEGNSLTAVLLWLSSSVRNVSEHDNKIEPSEVMVNACGDLGRN